MAESSYYLSKQKTQPVGTVHFERSVWIFLCFETSQFSTVQEIVQDVVFKFKYVPNIHAHAA
jgi:hypothetical protein